MTGFGFTGPMTARGTTFSAKSETAVSARMLLLGAGAWLLWLLTAAHVLRLGHSR